MKTAEKKSSRQNWQPFEEARAFVHGLGLRNRNDWAKWAKSKARPDDIPVSASLVYKNEGWKNWKDWLGYDHVANLKRNWLPYKDAIVFIHSLNLKNSTEWRKWAKSGKRPKDIPSRPDQEYENKGWVYSG